MHMDNTINLALGFVLGVLSSAVFWYALLFIKPNIAVSREVALNPKTNKLRIKVINRSWRFAKDLHASLLIGDRHLEGDIFTIGVLKELPLGNASLSMLAPIQDLYKPWWPPTIYVFNTETLTDELALLMAPPVGERRLEFTLQATDAMSNTTSVQVITYRPCDIKLGGFVDSMSLYVTGPTLEEQNQAVLPPKKY